MKRNYENTVPCGAPVLFTIFSDTQPFSLTNWSVYQVFSNPVGGGDINLYLLELLIQQGRLNCIKALEKSKNMIPTLVPALSR